MTKLAEEKVEIVHNIRVKKRENKRSTNNMLRIIANREEIS